MSSRRQGHKAYRYGKNKDSGSLESGMVGLEGFRVEEKGEGMEGGLGGM